MISKFRALHFLHWRPDQLIRAEEYLRPLARVATLAAFIKLLALSSYQLQHNSIYMRW